MCENGNDLPGNPAEFHIGKAIHEVDNLIYRNMLAQGRKYGYDQVTVMNGWIVKYLLMNQDKDIFQKDIEMEFGITKSTVAGIIKLMTDKGREYEEKMGAQFQRDEQMYRENITDEEFEIFIRVLNKIKQNVKE